MPVAGGAGIRDRRICNGFLRQQGDEGMAANVANFSTFSYSGHVAAHTIAKGVDGMCTHVGGFLVTFAALFGTGRPVSSQYSKMSVRRLPPGSSLPQIVPHPEKYSHPVPAPIPLCESE